MFKRSTLERIYSIIFILILIFTLYVFSKLINNNNNNNNNIIKCNMKFGLCPSARCVSHPYDDSKAFCFCDVVNGENYSVGGKSCKDISPYRQKTGEEIIFSDFSPNIKNGGYHLVNCPPKAVNLNCMNKKCFTNPNDTSKAICICDKTDNKGLNWSTFNKNGEPKICNYKSGASTQSNINLMNFIKQNP